MPTRKAKYHGKQRTFDTRPDRFDIRDRIYQPKLVNLPESYPSPAAISSLFGVYAKHLVLDQGTEGACTGFGLAALVNFLNFKDAVVADYAAGRLKPNLKMPPSVSPRMLYENARLYDEWPGEDYEGSSCRGAMKGWHRHGVCGESDWPYLTPNNQPGRPQAGWEKKAGAHPLGAYYRIETDEIAAVQSAILEVGAVFASADVHKGWNLQGKGINASGKLPIIPWKSTFASDGGHAFALVGFTEEGFIVQNSWGPNWGYKGFALIAYDDWLTNSSDAWVGTRGVPRPVVPVNFSSHSLPVLSGTVRSGTSATPSGVTVWSEEEARKHCLVIGNDGAVIRGSAAHTPESFVTELLMGGVRDWMASKNTRRKIVVYAHGGLNDEAAGVMRARIMGPAIQANEIYPVFVVWKTGWLESLLNIGEDELRKILPATTVDRGPAGNLIEKFREKASDAWDRTVENALGWLGKSLWGQMKQNAGAAGGANQAASFLARGMRQLSIDFPNSELHLIGHSAGTIWNGNFLSTLFSSDPSAKVASCQLFAAACTVGFANTHYGNAFKSGMLSPKKFRCYHLDDKAERADSVGGFYRKSLLYFVSRACEEHKTPILGMEAAWNPSLKSQDIFTSSNAGFTADLKAWRAMVTNLGVPAPVVIDSGKQFNDGKDPASPSHGGFDNDLATVNAALSVVLGVKPSKPVVWLSGY